MVKKQGMYATVRSSPIRMLIWIGGTLIAAATMAFLQISAARGEASSDVAFFGMWGVVALWTIFHQALVEAWRRYDLARHEPVQPENH